MTKEPTQERQMIIDYPGNTVVTAKPGSGKTYTVVEKISKVLMTLPDYKGVIAISFTNKASDELKKRCNQKGISAKQSFFGTIDKFYISQIIIPFASHLTNSIAEYSVCSDIRNDSKYSMLVDFSIKPSRVQEVLLIAALSEGKIFLEKSGEIALYILRKVPGAIMYIRARFSHIFIDEYQDCGEIQHNIFLQLVNAGLVGIAVGDINQAIFGFAKRFPKYLIQLIGNSEFKHFELNKNHRCHPSISEYSLCLFDASKFVPEDKRVFLVNVQGGEIEIAQKIDKYLDSIKKKYGVAHNNKIAILCRGNGTIGLLDKVLQSPHKIFVDTALDKDTSDWGRLFRDVLVACFDNNVYAMDYADELFSEETEPEKYRKALHLCSEIFSCMPETISTVEDKFICLAKLLYPKGDSDNARELLHDVLFDDKMIQSYVPAADHEINIMTLHKSKGLEFNIVFHMDMYKYIISDDWGDIDEVTQLLNLHYVGVTRAIDVCYIMNGSKRYRSKCNDFVPAYPSGFLNKPGLFERRKSVIWE